MAGSANEVLERVRGAAAEGVAEAGQRARGGAAKARAAIGRRRQGRWRTRIYAALGMVTWKVGKRYARRRLGRLRLRPRRPSA